MEVFQRHVTTAAYKLAGGVDLSSVSLTKPTKQNPITAAFVTKITRTFIDVLYSFLNGMVQLVSDDMPSTSGKRQFPNPELDLVNSIELLDLSNSVRLCDSTCTV